MDTPAVRHRNMTTHPGQACDMEDSRKSRSQDFIFIYVIRKLFAFHKDQVWVFGHQRLLCQQEKTPIKSQCNCLALRDRASWNFRWHLKATCAASSCRHVLSKLHVCHTYIHT